MSDLSDPAQDEKRRAMHRAIETWAADLAPVVRLVDELDRDVGLRLQARLAEQFAAAEPELCGMWQPGSFVRCCGLVLDDTVRHG